MPKEPKLLTPTVTIAVTHEGRQVLLRQGRTLVRVGHPITVGREQLFEPVRVDYELVEQATAAPGEKRAVKLPPANPAAPSAGEGRKQAD